ncbi:MAG: ATP-binding protein [Cyclobacteriaceae bacterium]|nr:ATP-binding protein [Cyclobacteriaceae bacterium]MBX2957192.1 ATP-binding protein [Cyclobacteriaceae bacterium]
MNETPNGLTMKNLHEKFSSIDLLNYLFTKIGFMFSAQLYIAAILEEAKRRSRMVGVLGREGMGKSSAIAHYIQSNQQVYYLRIGTTYTISNLFNEMLFQLSGVYPTINETLFMKMKQISYQLTKDNSKKLIIIDDAGRLSPRGLSTWFELRDNTIQTTGFVFIGLDYFQKNLLQARKNGVPGIAEFYRRVENWYTVPSIKKSEIASYGLKHKLTDDQVLQLHDSSIETIADLENMKDALLEEAQLAEKEERPAKKINVPGQSTLNNGTQISKKSRGEDDEEEEDELEEEIASKKKESAKRAREAKKTKAIKPVTSDATTS